MNTFSAVFEKDFSLKTIQITLRFNFPVSVVWDAFTNPKTMEKWFVPEPYKAVTKSMDFREGGQWLYYMLAPDGKKIWSVEKYKKIRMHTLLEIEDAFSDRQGVVDSSLPRILWRHSFSEEGTSTAVDITLSFGTGEDMKRILSMGFEEGYTMGLNQLERK